jgi:hypothetical protein
MSPGTLTALVVLPTAVVVVAFFMVVWRERTTTRSTWIAVITGVVLGSWAIGTGVLASRGNYLPRSAESFPPVGIQLIAALAAMVTAIAVSPSLRGLLTNQRNLIRLNVWRLEGAVFLLLMLTKQVPALWALPAGLGDVLIGGSAFWVAGRLDKPGGKRRAKVFNLLGVLDLIVAVGLGVLTNSGPAQVFHPSISAEMLTRFPLVLVPSFLVPLAFMLHVVSLWQLSVRPWRVS